MVQPAAGTHGLDSRVAVALVAAAVPGVPALVLMVAALSAGYSWQPLPFNLVPPAVVLMMMPLLALGVSRISRRRQAWLVVAIVLSALTAAVTGLVALVLFLFVPLSLLDDSGNALANFDSILGADLVGAITAVANAVLAGTMISTRHQRPGPGVPRRALLAGMASVALALGVAALVGWAGSLQTDAAGIPTAPISASWISSREEAKLLYPGAQVVEKVAGGEGKQVGVGTPAEVFVDFYSSDTSAAVAGWYGSALQGRGWHPSQAIGASTQAQVWAFRRGERELFVLALMNPGEYPADAYHAGQRHFETRYTVFPTSGGHA